MNCRAGDLAIVIRGDYAGTLVEVLYAAPVGRPFRLPHGVISEAVLPGRWVVQILGSPIPATNSAGVTYLASIGVANDTSLRPLRGGDLGEPFTVPTADDFSTVVKP